uniref:Uncharacterized protein n=1 Tax=Chlamydomonas leiostraca TaxID=1034604 RepID=A0A7S0RWZ8_9CHLO|mmetsp:Transcript_33494/g.84874  ORF Transcript_33494/g.84874 Transcript_33494/m.84874 type:complete len:432 (+) Transcript_33494:56-1351(+)
MVTQLRTKQRSLISRGVEWAWVTTGAVVGAIWKGLMATPPGKALQATHAYQYLEGVLWSAGMVFFQKFGMFHLDHIDFVGGSVKGLTAIVTGPTSGIGKETAAALARRGAKVVLACRSAQRGAALKAEIEASTVDHGFPKPHVEVALLDLASLASVRAFCAAWEAGGKRELHILVNNAGVSFMKKCFTEEGVGGIAQTNYLGPYTLTRLLEKKLVASKARIVTVASIKHRETRIKDAKAFLTDWRSGYYEHSKLANVLMAYELQRRLGPLGVTSCAADPGGVRSNIWAASPMFKAGFYKKMIDACYSPPEDGAQAVIYAATVDWSKDKDPKNKEDLRYYSRGLFNHPIITGLDGLRGKGTSWGQHLAGVVWGLTALSCSLVDWPLRKISGGKLFGSTKRVRSSTGSYNAKLAAELWDVSAELIKMPKEPQA